MIYRNRVIPNKVLAFASKEAERAIHWVGVNEDDVEEVKSLVLEAIWRWWIPAANKRLQNKTWKPTELKSKIRTALRQYTKNKSQTVALKRKRNQKTLEEARFVLNKDNSQGVFGDGFEPDKEELRFLKRIMQNSAPRAKEIGLEQTRIVLRVIVLMKRYSNKIVTNTSRFEWHKLFREISELIEGV